ncbi:hypothetical protein AGLY_004272 [Aphis glycines]|uniref:Uncharacterized protein n=1 Tax=Aphis glycines TaxID=307491 RepID=A0A6G0U023_APHGL|nr:hypothetical protein AGLY_004272 [Aphis glycines]
MFIEVYSAAVYMHQRFQIDYKSGNIKQCISKAIYLKFIYAIYVTRILPINLVTFERIFSTMIDSERSDSTMIITSRNNNASTLNFGGWFPIAKKISWVHYKMKIRQNHEYLQIILYINDLMRCGQLDLTTLFACVYTSKRITRVISVFNIYRNMYQNRNLYHSQRAKANFIEMFFEKILREVIMNWYNALTNRFRSESFFVHNGVSLSSNLT